MSSIYHNNDEFYASCNHTLRGCRFLVLAGGLHAVLSVPTVTIGVVSNLILVIVSLRTIPYLGHMNILIIVSAVFEIPFLINEAVLVAFLPKGLPWLTFKGIYFENWTHLGCKVTNYFQSFLSTGRVNILLLETLFCYYMSRIRQRKLLTPNFLILPVAVCLILAALHAIPIAMTYQLWIWHDKVLCDIDPVWPLAIVLRTKLSQSLFCDGLIPAVFILLLNLILYTSAKRVSRLLRWIQAFENHPCVASDALAELHQRLYAIHLNIKLVQLHSIPIALSRIVKAVLRMEQSYLVYNPDQDIEHFQNSLFTDRCFEVLFWRHVTGILSWLEIVWSSLHFWWFYMYVPDVRKAMLECGRLIGLRKFLRSSHIEVPPVRSMRMKIMGEERRFSRRYYDTLESLSDDIPYEVLCRSCRSLAIQNDLPPELLKFRDIKLNESKKANG